MAKGTCDCGRSFPRGYRFRPTDEDYLFYLKLKIEKKPIPITEFSEVNLYEYDPQTISERYPRLGDNGWHVFTSRNRKYKNGLRPDRAARTGYWKATGKDIAIIAKNSTPQVTLGYKKALVFCQGRPPKGIPTHWGMYEYMINKPQQSRRGSDDMKLDDWVLCRIYQNQRRRDGSINSSSTAHDQSQQNSLENIESINVGDGSISSGSAAHDQSRQNSMENIGLINVEDGAIVENQAHEVAEPMLLDNSTHEEALEYQDYGEADPLLMDNSAQEEVRGFEDNNLIMEHQNYNWISNWIITNNSIMRNFNPDLQTQSQNAVATSINQAPQFPVLQIATPTYVNQVHQFSGFQNVFAAPDYFCQVSQLPVFQTQFENVVASANHVDSQGSIPTETVDH